jgi:2-dehydropantoate 2-reductase
MCHVICETKVWQIVLGSIRFLDKILASMRKSNLYVEKRGAIMKIAVIGAGAVGSVIGGLLSKAGEDVTLVGRKLHVDAINQNGLVLEGESGKTVIPVKAAENLDFKPDLALITAKSQDVESSVRKAQPFLSGALVVTAQNGVQSDDIVAAVLGKENIISSVVLYNCEFLEPGKVSYSKLLSKIALLVGEPFGIKGNRLQTLTALFNKAIPTDISEDIRGAHWTKLLWNLITAVPAVTGLSYQEGNHHPQIRELNVNLMKEGLVVVTLAGIKPAPVPGFPLSFIETIAKTPLSEASSMMKKTIESGGERQTLGSILQSIKRGRSTEVDYMNGEIVTLGKKMGVPTPANSLMVELVHQVEATGKFLTLGELTQRSS